MRVGVIAGSGPAASLYVQSLARRSHDVAAAASTPAVARLLAGDACPLAVVDFDTPSIDAAGTVAGIRGAAGWARCLIVGIGAKRAATVASMAEIGVDEVIFGMTTGRPSTPC
ncbi:MAG: hypothetical protein ACR2OO_11605 [Thermomicrobiales bacterium]